MTFQEIFFFHSVSNMVICIEYIIQQGNLFFLLFYHLSCKTVIKLWPILITKLSEKFSLILLHAGEHFGYHEATKYKSGALLMPAARIIWKQWNKSYKPHKDVLVNKQLHTWRWSHNVIAEPPKAVLSLLRRYWVAFQRQYTKTTDHTAEAYAEERTWTSSCTWYSSLFPSLPQSPPHIPAGNKWTRTKPELEHWLKSFRSQGSAVQKYPLLTPPTINGQAPRHSN